MNAQAKAVQAAVEYARKYVKENAHRAVNVASSPKVQEAARDLGRALRAAWSESGPSGPQPAVPL
jgi:hypothetical protein